MSTRDVSFLLLSSSVGRAHRRRLGLVAHALRKLGVRVVLSDLPDVTADPRGSVFAEFSPSLTNEIIDSEVALIDEVRPDVVVGDFRPTAAISARIRQTPYVSIINAAQSRAFDPAGVLMPSAGGLRRRIASGLTHRQLRAQKRQIAARFHTATDRAGLARFDTLDDLLAGDLTLLADLPDFVPLTGRPPKSLFVGPLVWEPPDTLDWLAERDPDRPLFYATAGHTGDPRLLDLTIDAFAGRPGADVIISLDDVTDFSGRELPSHIRVRDLVPGGAVLAQASGVIHAGGSGTMYQVMAHEVPAIVLPGTVDQEINATLIDAYGLGLALNVEKAGGEAVWAGFRRLSQERWRNEPLRQYGRRARECDGPTAAAMAILNFATTPIIRRQG